MAIDQYSVAVEHLKEAPAVTPQDVLNRAADLLEEFGWCQGHPAVDSRGEKTALSSNHAAKFCVMGAIFRAKADLGIPSGFVYAGHEDIGLDYAASFDVWNWNDNPMRTKDAVVLALRAGLPQFRNV